MFNNSLKKEALSIHEKALKGYNQSYQRMTDWAETLYTHRVEAENQIKRIELVVNSVANTPKEYDTKMGNVRQQLINFRKTREYAKKPMTRQQRQERTLLAVQRPDWVWRLWHQRH